MKIAIVKLSALGDIVHAMLALQFIKAAVPTAQIDWVVEERFAGLLANQPHINRVLTINFNSLKTNKLGIFPQLGKIRTYAAADYDVVIDAQGLIKSALLARLLSPTCIGFDQNSIREKPAAWFYGKTVACRYDSNTIERNLTVLTQHLGVSISREQILLKQPFLFYHPPETPLETLFPAGKKHVLFVIGSTWPSRNYPKEKYLQVIQGLAANCLIICGNEAERQTAEWIAQRSQATVLPYLSLNDLKAAIDQADLLIGNDTGPTHMAWGLNRPSLTLFGPTPVSRVYQTGINKVLKSPSAVNPYKLNKNDFSIGEINAQTVIAMAKSLL